MGNNITARLKSNLLSNPIHGAFLDSCDHHCGDVWNSIHINGADQATAFAQWYAKGATRLWDAAQPYPCASCCQ
jgi:hypothetical protein